jgi:3-oxoacyl-[acyl-carrier-protein] synthase-1
MTGHALGAAGAVEAMACVLAIRDGFVPPGVGTQEVDPALKARYEIAGGRREVKRAMSNSFGFGGSNCSLVFGRLREAA